MANELIVNTENSNNTMRYDDVKPDDKPDTGIPIYTAKNEKRDYYGNDPEKEK